MCKHIKRGILMKIRSPSNALLVKKGSYQSIGVNNFTEYLRPCNRATDYEKEQSEYISNFSMYSMNKAFK